MLRLFTRAADLRDGAAPAPPAQPAGTGSLAQAGRRELMERITEFMLTHELDVTPRHLALAQAAFSGADLGLATRIAEQELAGKPVTAAWLDDVSPPRADDERKALEQLMTRLDGSLASFAAATNRASGTTASYGDELSTQVGDLGALGSEPLGGEVVSSLVRIARAMLDRTREIEQEMKRSSREAEALRASLDRARREADIDHLTGLPNRRAFESLLQTQIREAQAEIEHLTVAICDIDHFKAVNDTHGHETGDRVIQAVAQVLARISSERCHVARHGGEEFVLLLRGSDVDGAVAILDDARQQLAERRFINRQTDQPIGQVTFSGGVANVFGFGDPRDALRAADRALYRAKAEGRNRICAA